MDVPRFIADEMNGDIAKWLRIIGFDCLYITGKDLDEKLIEIAHRENRILLTSDRELYRIALKRRVETLYTSGQDIRQKLKKIIDILELNKYIKFLAYRCPICNNTLESRKSSDIHAPEYIVNNYNIVYYCKNCSKIYWKGSHWKNIKRTLNKLGIHDI